MLKTTIRHCIYEVCISAFFDVLTRNRKPKLIHRIYTQPKRRSNQTYDPRKVSVVWSNGTTKIPIRSLRGYCNPVIYPSNECWQ